MNELVKSKYLHYIINADYSIPGLSIDNQTNLYISKAMNTFINTYGVYFKDKKFAFVNQDNLISLIEYGILCRIRELTDFNFVILNKPKNLKKFFSKNEIYIKRKHLTKDFYWIISSNNPLYKLCLSKENYYESLNINLYEVPPTPAELFCIQILYGLTYNDPIIKSTSLEIEGLNEWFKKPLAYIVPPKLNQLVSVTPHISMCWIEDNNEKDSKTLQEIEQKDSIVFYFYKEDEIPLILTDKTFIFLLKYRTNVPAEQYGNLNNYDLAKLFLKENVFYDFYGDWPVKKKQTLLEVIK